jgi:hypothetical protein
MGFDLSESLRNQQWKYKAASGNISQPPKKKMVGKRLL